MLPPTRLTHNVTAQGTFSPTRNSAPGGADPPSPQYKAEDGSAKLEDFLFDDIMECPDLLPGDAILMRGAPSHVRSATLCSLTLHLPYNTGDCFHRTQDHATDRVALSIRINRLDSKLTKAIHELDTESRRTWRREAPLFPSMMDYAFTLQEEWTWEGILKKKAELGL